MRAVALSNPEGCEADTMANLVRPLRCTLSVPVKPSTCQSGATNQGSPSAKQQATHSRGSGYAYPPWARWGLSELPGWAGRPGWLAGGEPRCPKASSTERAAADWHVRGPQNGLGWLGWLGWLAGWLAGLQAVSNSVPESSVPFGRGPPAVGRSQTVTERIWSASSDEVERRRERESAASL